jgi:hypothetical protein
MKKNSTLIYFVNNFNSEKKSWYQIENADTDLLTAMEFNPSEQSIKNIMNFARSYEVLETENTGQVEMILN